MVVVGIFCLLIDLVVVVGVAVVGVIVTFAVGVDERGRLLKLMVEIRWRWSFHVLMRAEWR
jgi:hypothetical protein